MRRKYLAKRKYKVLLYKNRQAIIIIPVPAIRIFAVVDRRFDSKMRKRPGIGAIQKQKIDQERFRDKGTELQDATFDQMAKQMEVFRTNLETLAAKHRNEIKRDPNFRKQFQEMCASIGVDPLASSKGFWSELLGVGDFYYELSVQVVEVCMATSHLNGGLITLKELRQRLVKARGKAQHHQQISKYHIIPS